MNEFTNAPCVRCGKTISIITYQYKNGVRTICLDCQRKLEDEKDDYPDQWGRDCGHEALSTD
jgi:DNA-directed RNA polymerase subunit RPC12/RpoP